VDGLEAAAAAAADLDRLLAEETKATSRDGVMDVDSTPAGVDEASLVHLLDGLRAGSLSEHLRNLCSHLSVALAAAPQPPAPLAQAPGPAAQPPNPLEAPGIPVGVPPVLPAPPAAAPSAAGTGPGVAVVGLGPAAGQPARPHAPSARERSRTPPRVEDPPAAPLAVADAPPQELGYGPPDAPPPSAAATPPRGGGQG
jgi:hypothetical protein